ncbi:MAG: cytochrome-c peroxidase [Campylobacterales bacterium]|nr:cytochrome-c peroxidase [Campylobacterales bacterium]
MRLFFVLIFLIGGVYGEGLISPIPQFISYNKQKALLGKKLFHDPRLSKDNTISCATCHNLDIGGDDNLPYSFGIKGQVGTISSPTVLNSGFNFLQFWDGRAKDLKEQVSGPIHNPIEMGSSFGEVIEKLEKDEEYVVHFEKVYSGKITEDRVADAIAEFEKALYTPNGKFDKYLRGKTGILSNDEKEGYLLFKEYGCISCHNGINVGGNLYQKFGVMKNYVDKHNQQGLYNLTKNEEDKYYFKVPTLRNIQLTAPYFHDGSATDLQTAIEVMIEYQLGITPEKKHIEKIEKFLLTLTGEKPKIMNRD